MRPRSCRLRALALLIVLFPVTAPAATLHVPGQYPTIQSAVSAAAADGDSVVVAPGTYLEDVVVAGKRLAIAGAASAKTSARSFTWTSAAAMQPGGALVGFTVEGGVHLVSFDYGFELSFCHVAGPADLSTGGGSDEPLRVLDCAFESSVTVYGDRDDSDVSVLRCTVDHGNLDVQGAFADVGACGLTGGSIHASGHETVSISGTTVHQGNIDAGGGVLFSNASGNQVFGGRISLSTSSGDGSVHVDGNYVEGGGVDVYSDEGWAYARGNTLLGGTLTCDGTSNWIQNNRVFYGGGILVKPRSEVTSNLVVTCTIGIRVQDPSDSVIGSNTVVRCQTGLQFVGAGESSVERNVLVLNGQGIALPPGTDASFVACNDTWSNAPGGDYVGVPDQNGINGNFSTDPLFCDAPGNNYTLESTSPCLPGRHPYGADCGLIGALGQGCTAVSVEPAEGASAGWIVAPNPARSIVNFPVTKQPTSLTSTTPEVVLFGG